MAAAATSGAYHTRSSTQSSPPRRRHATTATKGATSYVSAQAPPPPPPDVYYGHEMTAKMCSRYITTTFSCPEQPSQPTTSTTSVSSPPLAAFVAYALHRTRLPSSVTYAALFLLSRLKQRFPAARGSSGHRLFISAFMIASKVVCDDTYSNKSWCVVGQGMFSLKEINQMEREMCSYLDWILHIDASELSSFEDDVNRTFGNGVANSAATKTAPSVAVCRPVTPESSPEQMGTAAYPSPESSPASPLTPDTSGSSSPESQACHTPPTSTEDMATIVAPGNSAYNGHQTLAKTKERPFNAFAFAAPAVW